MSTAKSETSGFRFEIKSKLDEETVFTIAFEGKNLIEIICTTEDVKGKQIGSVSFKFFGSSIFLTLKSD